MFSDLQFLIYTSSVTNDSLRQALFCFSELSANVTLLPSLART